MRKRFADIGVFGLFVCVGMLAFGADKLGANDEVLRDMGRFLSGDLSGITRGWTSVGHALGILAAVVALDIPLSFFLGTAVRSVYGGAQSNSIGNFFERLAKSKKMFPVLFGLCFAEELFRYVFIGALPRIPGLGSVTAWYALFFASNAAWAVIHLRNYRDPSERRILRVLPQFVGGILLSYVYFKCGFLCAVIAHFVSNAVLHLTNKKQYPGRKYCVNAGWEVFVAIVTYALMTKSIADAGLWLAKNPTFALPGWTLIDYVLLSLFACSMVKTFFNLIMSDTESEDSSSKNSPGIIAFTLGMALVVALYLFIEWVFFKILGNRFESMVWTAIVIGCLVSSATSGSAMTRGFFVRTVNVFIGLCVFHAVGYGAAILYVGIEALADLPRRLIVWLVPGTSQLDEVIEQLAAER